jgi:flagellar biosynthesis/type III secretory pathway chaperone
MSLFGTKEKEEIERLSNVVKDLEKSLEKSTAKETQLLEIIKEKDEKIEKISKSPHDRQFEKITIAFDNVKNENQKLKEEKNKLKEELEELKVTINSLKSDLEGAKISKDNVEARYKVLIKDLYSARRHDEFKKVCDDLNVIYADDLEGFDFEKLIAEGHSKTKMTNAKNEYLNYKEGHLSAELKEYIEKGHKISKVFFRYRSFVSFLTELKIEYMFELEGFDFEKLDKEHFTPAQIEKLKEKLSEYNTLRKL